MKRRVPRLRTDEEAEAFLDSDLSDLDFSQFKSGRLRFVEPSEPSATYRLFEQAMIEELGNPCAHCGTRKLCGCRNCVSRFRRISGGIAT